MDYDTFIGEVQNRAQLASREEALHASRVTLETLRRRIDVGTAENVGAQLPKEIGRHLAKVDAVEPFPWEDFVDRIVEAGTYSSTTEADAVHHARVVMDVVAEAVDAGNFEDIREQLPVEDDWDELFALVDQEPRPVGEDQRPDG